MLMPLVITMTDRYLVHMEGVGVRENVYGQLSKHHRLYYE